MNKIIENINRLVTCTAYRNNKAVSTWAKCLRKDGTSYWQTVEEGDLTGPEIESEDFTDLLEVLKSTGVRLDFNNHSEV